MKKKEKQSNGLCGYSENKSYFTRALKGVIQTWCFFLKNNKLAENTY